MASELDTMTTLPALGDLTYREWHAFINGLYSGFVWGHRQHPYGRERHYWRAGYMIGTMVRYTGLALLYREIKRE
ncbi:hypothetical protein HSR121_2083 [Halapricum desulfuricans]|uniref:Uncharacterized protein n=1 Tax=Halapricum desulfuricans TaxID=2841257 RepID=A0A897N5Y9_9EURY|nr:hypothetical protein HSR121_2083 [Halapricum desulfuricans]